jgi:hypothetical protein
MTPTELHELLTLLTPPAVAVSGGLIVWLILREAGLQYAALSGLWVAVAPWLQLRGPVDTTTTHLPALGAGLVLLQIQPAGAALKKLFAELPWEPLDELAQEVVPRDRVHLTREAGKLLAASVEAAMLLVALMALAGGFGLPSLIGPLGVLLGLAVGVAAGVLVTGAGFVTLGAWRKAGSPSGLEGGAPLLFGLVVALTVGQALPLGALVIVVGMLALLLPQNRDLVHDLIAGLDLYDRANGKEPLIVMLGEEQVQVRAVHMLTSQVLAHGEERTVRNHLLAAALRPAEISARSHP